MRAAAQAEKAALTAGLPLSASKAIAEAIGKYCTTSRAVQMQGALKASLTAFTASQKSTHASAAAAVAVAVAVCSGESHTEAVAAAQAAGTRMIESFDSQCDA